MFKLDRSVTAKKLMEWNIEYDLGLTSRSVQRGKLILEEGQKCNYFFYVIKGLIRVYYNDINGHEITHWFTGKDMMITSPFSFFKNEPNILYFQAIEDTEMILLTESQMETLISLNPKLNKKLRSLYVEFAMVFSRRIMSIHTQTAEERYLQLMEVHPFIMQKAKLAHIASFLGITPQSLSRIRRNLSH